MTIAFRAFPAAGVVAMFVEAPGGGDIFDINAPCNAPALDPENHLASIYLHSGLDNFEVVSDTTVTINHLQANGLGSGSIGGSIVNAMTFNRSSADNLLVTHSLGYVPDCIVLVDDQILFPGRPVQSFTDGRGRYCTAYATTTAIRLAEWTAVSASNLTAQSIDYRVIVFKQPPAPSGDELIDFDPDTGVLQLAFGRFNSSRAYAQVVAGGSPFGVAFGKTMDFANGAVRFVNPDGTTFEPIPNTQKGRWEASYSGAAGSFSYTGAYGSAMSYTGSFAGPEQISVQAP